MSLNDDVAALPERLRQLVVLGMLSGMSRREVVDEILKADEARRSRQAAAQRVKEWDKADALLAQANRRTET